MDCRIFMNGFPAPYEKHSSPNRRGKSLQQLEFLTFNNSAKAWWPHNSLCSLVFCTFLSWGLLVTKHSTMFLNRGHFSWTESAKFLNNNRVISSLASLVIWLRTPTLQISSRVLAGLPRARRQRQSPILMEYGQPLFFWLSRDWPSVRTYASTDCTGGVGETINGREGCLRRVLTSPHL